MSLIIILHNFANDLIHINVDDISQYRAVEDGDLKSIITFRSSNTKGIYVKETPKEIDELIRLGFTSLNAMMRGVPKDEEN